MRLAHSVEKCAAELRVHFVHHRNAIRCTPPSASEMRYDALLPPPKLIACSRMQPSGSLALGTNATLPVDVTPSGRSQAEITVCFEGSAMAPTIWITACRILLSTTIEDPCSGAQLQLIWQQGRWMCDCTAPEGHRCRTCASCTAIWAYRVAVKCAALIRGLTINGTVNSTCQRRAS